MREKTFITSLILAVLLIVGCLTFLPLKYDVNDDPIITLILSGKDGFSPDFLYLYMSPIISYLLSCLYSLELSLYIPWFGIFLYFCLFLSLLICSYVILDRQHYIKFIFLFISFLFYFHIITHLSFTSVALILQLSALALFWHHININKSLSAKFQIIILLIFMVGFLLRPVTIMFIIFAFPILLPVKMFYQHTRKYWLLFVAALFIICANLVISKIINSDDISKSYKKYNSHRSLLLDTYHGAYNKETTLGAITQAGWTEKEFIFFRDLYFFYDSQKFNYDSLNIFLSKNKTAFKTMAKHIVKYTYDYLDSAKFYLLILLIALILLIIHNFINNRKLINRGYVIKSVLLTVILLMFFMSYRFPLRVSIPVFIFILIGFLNLFKKTEEKTKAVKIIITKYFKFIFLLICIIGTLISFTHTSNTYTELKVFKKANNHMTNAFLDYLKDNKKRMLLQIGLPLDILNPLDEFGQFPEIKWLPIGWTINSPRYYKILDEIGFTSGNEFITNLHMLNDLVVVIFDNKKGIMEKSIYMFENYLKYKLHDIKTYGVDLRPHGAQVRFLFINLKK